MLVNIGWSAAAVAIAAVAQGITLPPRDGTAPKRATVPATRAYRLDVSIPLETKLESISSADKLGSLDCKEQTQGAANFGQRCTSLQQPGAQITLVFKRAGKEIMSGCDEHKMIGFVDVCKVTMTRDHYVGYNLNPQLPGTSSPF